MKLLRKLRNNIEVITRAADNQLYWDSIARQIGPSSIKESPEYVRLCENYRATPYVL
jgi:hypothetical protein